MSKKKFSEILSDKSIYIRCDDKTKRLNLLFALLGNFKIEPRFNYLTHLGDYFSSLNLTNAYICHDRIWINCEGNISNSINSNRIVVNIEDIDFEGEYLEELLFVVTKEDVTKGDLVKFVDFNNEVVNCTTVLTGIACNVLTKGNLKCNYRWGDIQPYKTGDARVHTWVETHKGKIAQIKEIDYENDKVQLSYLGNIITQKYSTGFQTVMGLDLKSNFRKYINFIVGDELTILSKRELSNSNTYFGMQVHDKVLDYAKKDVLISEILDYCEETNIYIFRVKCGTDEFIASSAMTKAKSQIQELPTIHNKGLIIKDGSITYDFNFYDTSTKSPLICYLSSLNRTTSNRFIDFVLGYAPLYNGDVRQMYRYARDLGMTDEQIFDYVCEILRQQVYLLTSVDDNLLIDYIKLLLKVHYGANNTCEVYYAQGKEINSRNFYKNKNVYLRTKDFNNKNEYVLGNLSNVFTLSGDYRGYHTSKDDNEPLFISNGRANKIPDNNNLYLGFELEVDQISSTSLFCESVVEYIKETTNVPYCTFETDGSLSCGIEIITQPCTIDVHRGIALGSFLNSIDTSFKCDNSRDAGLHIHVNKDFFDNWKDAVAKIYYIMYKFKKEVELIAGRGFNSYSKDFDCSSDFDDLKDGNLSLEEYTDNIIIQIDDDRYYKINIENDKTIEFRLFQSTSDPVKLMARLQFVNNLCHLVNELDSVQFINSLTFEEIVNYGNSDELVEYYKNI